jgi:hypothetical protein
LKSIVLLAAIASLFFSFQSNAYATYNSMTKAYCKISDLKFSAIELKEQANKNSILLYYRCGFKECAIQRNVNSISENTSYLEVFFENNSSLKIFKQQIMYGFPIANLNLGVYKYFAYQCSFNK